MANSLKSLRINVTDRKATFYNVAAVRKFPFYETFLDQQRFHQGHVSINLLTEANRSTIIMLPARCKGYKQLAMYITIKVFNVRIVLPSLRFVAALKLFKATCVNKHSRTH